MVDFAKLAEASRTRRALLNASPPIVVIDVETSGLDPWADRIFQLAACRIEKGHVVGTSSWYVNPEGVHVPEECLKRSGVRRRDVEAGGRPFHQVFNELLQWVQDAEIAAYHAPFDRAFVLASVARTWPRHAFASVPRILTRPWLDPLLWVWHFCPPPFSLRLGDTLRHLGLRGPGFKAHHAEEDAKGAADVVCTLLGGWSAQLLPLEQALELQRCVAPRREVQRWGNKQGISTKRAVTVSVCDVCGKHQVCHAPGPTWDRGPGVGLPEGWVRRAEQTLCGTACDFVHAWWVR